MKLPSTLVLCSIASKMAITGIAHSVALVVLVLCISHAQCRELRFARGERDVTGEGDETTLQTDLAEALRKVCENTRTAYTHDALPLDKGQLEERYKGKNFGDNFLHDKPVQSKS